MKHAKKVHRGALKSSHESHKRSHGVERGMSEDEGAPWGHGQFANMPKDVEVESYPHVHEGREKSLDDTIRGIDDWSRQMYGKKSKYSSDQH